MIVRLQSLEGAEAIKPLSTQKNPTFLLLSTLLKETNFVVSLFGWWHPLVYVIWKQGFGTSFLTRINS